MVEDMGRSMSATILPLKPWMPDDRRAPGEWPSVVSQVCMNFPSHWRNDTGLRVDCSAPGEHFFWFSVGRDFVQHMMAMGGSGTLMKCCICPLGPWHSARDRAVLRFFLVEPS